MSLFILTQVVYCMEKTFIRLSALYISGRSLNPFTSDNKVSFWQKKKNKNLLFAYVGVHISCKMIRMQNCIIGLETNSSGDVSLGKGKTLLLQ